MRFALAHSVREQRGAAFLESISETEKIIAFCRVLLAATTLAIALVDPKEPPWPWLTYGVLGGYVAFSLVLFWLVRGEYVRGRRVGPYSVVSDVVWAVLITLCTEGGATPFFLLNVFVISSVSVRWGFAASAPLTILLACLYPLLILFASRWVDPAAFTFQRAHLFRPVYLVALGYLVGYLGEHERRSKRKLAFMLALTSLFRRERAPGWGLTRLMRWVLQYFGAERGLLILRDPESERYFTWDMARGGGRLRLGLRISEHDPLDLPVVGPSEAFLTHGGEAGSATALCYDVTSGATCRRTLPPDLRLPWDGGEQVLLVTPVLIGDEVRGHAAVVRARRPRFTREDLQFLVLIAGQAAAGFEAVRLQRKAEEVAVLEERARIARDLHDGFIQALAGIDLRLEACRLVLERDPSRLPQELAQLQQTVERGYREVRHYLAVLRSASREAHDLASTLERIGAEFSMRDRLGVKLSLPPAVAGLSSSAAYEITQIVREALSNAARHGQATQALVKITAYQTHCTLVVRDNGRGFQGGGVAAADGTVSATAAPWSIRERAAALGGTLRVRSRSGEGTEVTVRIPLATEAEREPARRRSA